MCLANHFIAASRLFWAGASCECLPCLSNRVKAHAHIILARRAGRESVDGIHPASAGFIPDFLAFLA